MKLVLSREQCQSFDQRAMTEGGVPGVILMENAGRGAADVLLAHLGDIPHRVVVVCGPGSNGGDGFVVARRLRVKGHDVEVVLLTEPGRLTGDAKVMWDAYLGIGGRYRTLLVGTEFPVFEQLLCETKVIVDAIFGTGLTRTLSGVYAQVVERINAANALRFSLDLPSGLDADSGMVHGTAVRADVTVTFGHEKPGLLMTSGVEHAGQVELVDIGVPAQLHRLGQHWVDHYEASDLEPLWSARSAASHKGRSGRVGILAGHAGTTGAALLAARGALRMGAGLVTHLGTPDCIAAIESRVLEAMTRRLEPARLTASLSDAIHGMDALVMGPGLGLGPAQTELVHFVVEQAELPVVVDADALTLMSGNLKRFRLAKGPRILLPHHGELARLLECSLTDVEHDPIGALLQLTDLTHALVVMKGAFTFACAPGRKPIVLGEPCPAMATGGTGDVLAGGIGALLVDHKPLSAALLGVHLHSRAGVLWSEASNVDRGLLASELADGLPRAIAELSRPSGDLPH